MLGLQGALDPHLAGGLGRVDLALTNYRAGAHDVEVARDGRGAVGQLEAGGDAGARGELQDRAPAQALVQDRGQGPAVHDPGPPRRRRAKVHDAHDLPRGAVVEDPLEGEAVGAG